MKENINTSLRLILAYLEIVIGGTAISALVYMIYTLCTSMVAGSTHITFSFPYFIQGIQIILPFILFLSGIFMVFYLIRHHSNSILPVIFFAILYSISWLILMPACIHKFISSNSIQQEEKISAPLSTGYFRKYGDYIVWFNDVNEDNISSGICIETTQMKNRVHSFKYMKIESPDKEFNDSIIRQNVQIPLAFKGLLFMSSGFNQMLYSIFDDGFWKNYPAWLCFSTMGLALMSVVFIRFISSWRLSSVFWIILTSASIMIFNILVSQGIIFKTACTKVCSVFSFLPQKANGFLMIINITCSLIFLAIGIIVKIVRNHGPQDFSN